MLYGNQPFFALGCVTLRHSVVFMLTLHNSMCILLWTKQHWTCWHHTCIYGLSFELILLKKHLYHTQKQSLFTLSTAFISYAKSIFVHTFEGFICTCFVDISCNFTFNFRIYFNLKLSDFKVPLSVVLLAL